MKKFVIRCKRSINTNVPFWFWHSEKLWDRKDHKIFNSKEEAEKEIPFVIQYSSAPHMGCTNIEIVEQEEKMENKPYCAVIITDSNVVYYCDNDVWLNTPDTVKVFASKEIAQDCASAYHRAQFLPLDKLFDFHSKHTNDYLNKLKITLDQKLKTFTDKEKFVIQLKTQELFLDANKQFTPVKNQAKIFDDKNQALQFSGIFSAVVDVTQLVPQERWIIQWGKKYFLDNENGTYGWIIKEDPKELPETSIYKSEKEAKESLNAAWNGCPDPTTCVKKLS